MTVSERRAIGAIETDLKALVACARDTSPASWAGLIFSPRSAASKKIGDVMVSLLLPALEAALAAEHRNHTKHTLVRLSLALADYRDEHKTFPEKLAALRALPAEKSTEMLDFFGMMKMSRAQFIGFANNHSIHHRGQLAAYLRAMGSKVPNIYGPSADAEG